MTNNYTNELLKAIELHKLEMRNATASQGGRWAAMAFLPFGKSSIECNEIGEKVIHPWKDKGKKNMSSCWIIERGEHSDYRVVGIFTTREKAEQAFNYMKVDPDDYAITKITERKLDPVIAELNEGLVQFCVIIGPNRTDVRKVIDIDGEDYSWDGHSLYSIWARDEEHAIKIAAERQIANAP